MSVLRRVKTCMKCPTRHACRSHLACVHGRDSGTDSWQIEYRGDTVTGLVVNGRRVIGPQPLDDPLRTLQATLTDALELVTRLEEGHPH